MVIIGGVEINSLKFAPVINFRHEIFSAIPENADNNYFPAKSWREEDFFFICWADLFDKTLKCQKFNWWNIKVVLTL